LSGRPTPEPPNFHGFSCKKANLRIGNQLDFRKFTAMIPQMILPIEPVTLSIDQINELHGKLSALRHDVNNQTSLIAASVELMRRRPESAERMLAMLVEQPHKISESIAKFSGDMESALGITRS
jgi:hypothetical protein